MDRFDFDVVKDAAQALQNGDLVVMPTETVYGLAADASNSDAISKVFLAKGRPPENPLIAHVSSIEQAKSTVLNWDEGAQRLAEIFWPGPLSLILQRNPKAVCDQAAAGLASVAVRMPNHPLALALIEMAGCAICAPSANRFMHLSATSVADLDLEIISAAAMILNGGPCQVGIESTVVTLLDGSWKVLRKGAISASQIEAVIGPPLGEKPSQGQSFEESPHQSPGQYRRHYAPDVPVHLVGQVGDAPGLVLHSLATGSHQIQMPNEPRLYAAQLYRALHQLERSGVSEIQIELPPDLPEWEAVHDRLQRSAG